MTEDNTLVEDSYETPSARMVTISILLVVLLVLGIAVGLAAGTGGGSAEQGGCPLALQDIAMATPEVAGQVQLLVDVPSDAPASAQRIAADFAPVLRHALEEGAILTLVRDPGEGKPLGLSSCFDGTRSFSVDYENRTRQEQELAAALAAATSHLEQFLREAEVSPTGSPLRLLQRASSETGSSGTGSALVVVWSDFLSNAADCLNPNGSEATTETIEAIHRRCRDVGSLRPIGAQVALLGVGRTPRAQGFETWSRDLALALCQDLAPTCELG